MPSDSEARRIGGGWGKMSVLQEAEVVYVAGYDGIHRIFPLKAYRSKILEVLHQGETT